MACEICTGACDRVKGSKRSVNEDQRKKNVGLLAAAFVGHTECLNEFITAGANVNCTDGSFDQECQNNLSKKAKCPFEYDHHNRTSWTPLIYALKRGDQEITKLLLKAGARVNYAQGSETALVCAVGKCDQKLTEILVKQGADVNITNKNPKVEAPIVRAVAIGSTECLEILLNSGADVNISYSSICGNTTPILKSVECGILKCLCMLLEAGADVNLRAGGRSPIHEATIKENIECLNILIEAGADVNLQSRGRAPIHGATIKGNIKCLDKLIEAGADVNSRDKRGKTPILAAVFLGKTERIEHLVRSGADVNIPDQHGSTPLKATVSDWYFDYRSWHSEYYYLILVLLKAGADVKPVINKVFSFRAALFSATKYGGVQFVRLMLKNGAQINRSNEWQNAFGGIFCGSVYLRDSPLEILKYLHAAGEKLDDLILYARKIPGRIPEYFTELKENLDLKHLCREAIRKHLIDLDPHEHLFGRIPKLGLPSIVNDYLLYNCSLDSDEEIKVMYGHFSRLVN